HSPLARPAPLAPNLGAPPHPPALNQLLTNDGHAFFADFTATSLPGRPSEAIALGDVDGDGDLDAVTANPNSPNQLLINDGTGHFISTDLPEIQPTESLDIALGDLNGDGRLDAVVATFDAENQMLIQDSTGQF